jgi:hypothetical protein
MWGWATACTHEDTSSDGYAVAYRNEYRRADNNTEFAAIALKGPNVYFVAQSVDP